MGRLGVVLAADDGVDAARLYAPMPDALATQLDHVGLSVADLDTMSAWYCQALGMAEAERFAYAIRGREIKGALLNAPSGWRLELQCCTGSEPGQSATPLDSLLSHGLGHFCLRVNNADAAYELLLERGAGPCFAPVDSPVKGLRVGYITDPEGNFIELLEERVT